MCLEIIGCCCITCCFCCCPNVRRRCLRFTPKESRICQFFFCRWLFENLFIVSFLVTFGLQTGVVIGLHYSLHTVKTSNLLIAIPLMGSMQLLCWAIILFNSMVLYRHLWLCGLRPMFVLYISIAVCFAGTYLLLYAIYNPLFTNPYWLTEDFSYIHVLLIFINYSISTQTLTGVCAVQPNHVITEFITATQMFVGTAYSIFILSIAVQRFATKDFSTVDENEALESSEIRKSAPNLIDNNPQPTIVSPIQSECLSDGRGITTESRLLIHGVVKRETGIQSAISAPLSTPPSIIKINRDEHTQNTAVIRDRTFRYGKNTQPQTKSNFEFPSVTSFHPSQTVPTTLHSSRNRRSVPIGLARFRTVIESTASSVDRYARYMHQSTVRKRDTFGTSTDEPITDIDISTHQPSSFWWYLYCIFCCACFSVGHLFWKSFLPWFYNRMYYCFAIEIMRSLVIYALQFYDSPETDLSTDMKFFAVMPSIILDMILLLLVMLTLTLTVVHVAAIDSMRVNISLSSLIRSYLVQVFLFASLYFDLCLLAPTGVHAVFELSDDISKRFYPLYCHFVFFSITVSSGCGVAASIEPLNEVGQAIVSLQMFVGLIYHVVVFGVGMIQISHNRDNAVNEYIENLMPTIDGRTNNQELVKSKAVIDHPSAIIFSDLQRPLLQKQRNSVTDDTEMAVIDESDTDNWFGGHMLTRTEPAMTPKPMMDSQPTSIRTDILDSHCDIPIVSNDTTESDEKTAIESAQKRIKLHQYTKALRRNGLLSSRLANKLYYKLVKKTTESNEVSHDTATHHSHIDAAVPTYTQPLISRAPPTLEDCGSGALEEVKEEDLDLEQKVETPVVDIHIVQDLPKSPVADMSVSVDA